MALNQHSWTVKRGVLLGLLNSSGEIYIPTIKRFIFSEVANGVIDYIGGKAGEITYAKRNLIDDNFEPDLWKSFKEEAAKNRDKLPLDLKLVFGTLLEPSWSPAQPPDNGGEHLTDLYSLFKPSMGGGICEVYTSSRFSIPYGCVLEGREFMNSIDDETKCAIEQIGIKMKPFIQEDLKYIREHYPW